MNDNTLINKIEDAIFIHEIMENGTAGHMIEVNKFACKVLGYSYEELISMSNVELGDPLLAKKAPTILDLIQCDGSIVFEDNLLHKNGERLPFELKSYVESWNGRLCIFTIGRNILGQKQVMSEIQNAYDDFMNSIDAIDTILFIVDLHGDIIFLNKAASRKLGYTLDEVNGKSISIIHPESRRAEAQEVFKGMLNGGKTSCTIPLITKKGKLIPVETKVFPGKWNGKDILIGTSWDTSKLEKSIEELKNKDELLKLHHLIIEQSFTPVYVTDSNNKIVHANSAFNKIYGYDFKKEVLGKDPNFLSSGLVSVETYKDLWKNLSSKSHWEGNLIDRTKNGKNITARTVINVLKNAKGEVINYVAIQNDVTELTQMQTELGRSYLALQNNITEVIEAHAELQRINKRLESVIFGSNAGTWEWNIKSGETNFNERWAEMIGYSLDELQPVSIQTWIDYSHPEDLRSSTLILEKYLNGETELYECRSRMKHKDGHWIWVEDRGKISEWDEDGKPLKISGTHSDITELKSAKDILKHQVEIEELISGISTDLIEVSSETLDQKIQSVISVIGEFSKVDRSYVFLLKDDNASMDNTHEWCAPGIEPQIDNLKDIPTSILPWWMEKMERKENIVIRRVKDMPAEASVEKEVLESQDIISLLVVPIYKGDELLGFIGFDSVKEEKVWSDFDVYILNTFAHSVSNAIFSARSQKMLMVAKEEAEESEKRYHTLFENMLEGFVECKMIYEEGAPVDFVFLDVNSTFESLTGFTNVIGKKASELVKDIPAVDLELFQVYGRVALTGKPEKFEAFIESMNDWYSVAVYSPQKEYFIAVFDVISNRKRAEKEINELNEALETRVRERTEQLEAANKDLEAFSYSVSHDLHAPLRAMDGFANILLEDHASSLNSEGNRLLNIIIDTAGKMGHLIDDLLSFSRFGRQDLNCTFIDMKSIADEVYNQIPDSAEKQKIEFILNDIPEAKGDSAMVKQIWVNLIGNAVKYSSKVPYPVVEIGFETSEGENIYFIRDNGIGFNMEYYPKLFGVFQRLHTSREFQGNGVGLAMVQRIVNRHNGRIWAESIENEGATFYFTLPLECK